MTKGRNITIHRSGVEKMACSMVSLVPTDHATPPVINMATDISP